MNRMAGGWRPRVRFPASLVAAGFCGAVGLLTLEWRGLTRVAIEPAAGIALPPAAPLRHGAPGAGGRTAETQLILARPVFSPGRRPPPLLAREAALPRLTGLVITRRRQLALLQAGQSEGARAQAMQVGDRLSGWQVTMIDPKGVLLAGDGRVLRLAVHRAAIRPPPPIPIERVVLMPDKRSNPQLAW